VGTLYAELDEWKARISELRARLHFSTVLKAQAEEAREQARQTHEDAHGKASETHDFTPSPELKRLFREVAKRLHPDFAADAVDQERRTQFMAAANRAYKEGDAEALQRTLGASNHASLAPFSPYSSSTSRPSSRSHRLS
jgi:DnaJ-domain-containing protein 1